MIRKISAYTLNTIQNSNEKIQVQKTKQTQKIPRVEEIKEALQNGTYKIDIEKTATSFAKALL
ncbi:hypothetical protein JCM11957_15700 [Caminibacter profundus]